MPPGTATSGSLDRLALLEFGVPFALVFPTAQPRTPLDAGHRRHAVDVLGRAETSKAGGFDGSIFLDARVAGWSIAGWILAG
jgi:hypothetical protein